MALVWFANLNFNFILEWFEHGRMPEEEKLFKEEIITQKKEDKIYSDTLFEKDNIALTSNEELIISNKSCRMKHFIQYIEAIELYIL